MVQVSFFSELKRRNVFRVAIAYLAAAWLLSEVATTLFPLFGFGETPARVVVILLAIGLPLFLVFSWVFEITPEGLKLERDIDRTVSVTRKTGKQLDRAIIVLLVLALGYFAFDKFVLEPTRVADIVEEVAQKTRSEALVESFGEKSIAVLPFVNMSSDEEQEYFADGISEELLNLLAQIPNLRVISRSSAFSFKGQSLEVPEIAARLKVAHILEGSVRKSGNRVRISAQLIEAHSDTHLWSDTYDRTLNDVFAVQEEIATEVVEQLKITLLGDLPKARRTDPQAYALYLQALFLGTQLTAEGYQQSNTLYQQVLAIEPGYAAAWVGLARNYTNQAIDGYLAVGEASRLAREAASKALANDPGYGVAHASLSWMLRTFDSDLAGAAHHLEQALQLDPGNTEIIANSSALMYSLGRLNAAIELGEFVTDRDPVNPVSHKNLGAYYLAARRWDEAIASCQTALRLSPNSVGTRYEIGTALLLRGEPGAAMEAFSKEADEEYQVKGQALAFHALGFLDKHQAKLEELILRWGEKWPSEVAHVYAHTREIDLAFEWLEKSAVLEPGDFDPLDPYLDSLRADERWLRFLESIGKSPGQLAAVEFNLTPPE
jgi:TolB-like protein/Tfp pilus assembly protein PilF